MICMFIGHDELSVVVSICVLHGDDACLLHAAMIATTCNGWKATEHKLTWLLYWLRGAWHIAQHTGLSGSKRTLWRLVKFCM
jgi:hypothetical protein